MKPTESQLAEYKDAASNWAKERLADQNTVILDIESSGLLSQDSETEIVQICLLNIQGRALFSMMLKPSQPLKEEVIKIHQITNEQIVDQPIFPQIAKIIAFILKDKHVVSWNMDFDWKLLMHLYKKYKLETPKIAGASCAMDKYSEYAGEWNTKRDGFRWQRLPNFSGTVAHDAFADCQNALLAMQKMAGAFNEGDLTEDMIDLDF